MPKISSLNHQRVKVGHTIVEFFDNIAEVSQDVADVLLSLSGGDNQPEYFLVEEPKEEPYEPPVGPNPNSAIKSQPSTQYQGKKFDWKKGQSKGR